jgi:diadenylate cyclase
MDWVAELWIFSAVIRPVMDILILAFLIYQIYQILLQTRAIQLVKGIFLVVLVYALAFFFKLDTLLWIMNRMATVLVIIIAIVFQPELRNIFTRIGQGDWFKFTSRPRTYQLDSVINAVEVLASMKRGSLLVFPRKIGLKNIIETGTRLDANLSSSLILTVFAHDTSLHDGAMVIRGGKILAAGCFLPLSEQADIRSSFGTRHRAALGLAEITDAVVLVVSEESGAISLAFEANLHYDLNIEEISNLLKSLLDLREEREPRQEESGFAT